MAVTYEQITELANRFESAGNEYMPLLKSIEDKELLRQTAITLLVRASGVDMAGVLFAADRDDDIKRRLRELPG